LVLGASVRARGVVAEAPRPVAGVEERPTAALAARRASFSFARFRSSAFRARISAIRSAIGTSNRCFGLLA
jgi:hypothetical protein